MTSKAAKSAGLTATKRPPRGKPFVSGDPRQRPGTGRPPSALRALLRQSFEDRVHILQRIVDDPKSLPSDVLKAMDMQAKYGLGTTTAVVDTDGNDVQSPVVLLPAVAK